MDGLYRWDMETFRAINVGWHSEILTAFFWVLSYTGLSQIQIAFCLLLARKPSTRRFVIPSIATIAVTGLLFAQTIKKFVPRDRPSRLLIAIHQEDWRDKSFPSGHTTTAFALATMIALMTMGTRRWWLGPVALVWAFLVGVSRVYRGVHWPTDALAGAAAGIFGSAILYLIFAKKDWLNLTLEQWIKPRPMPEKPGSANST